MEGPRRRPHHRSWERPSLLWHQARHGLSPAATAKAFVVSVQTLLNWHRDADLLERTLVRGRTPLRRASDLVAQLVVCLQREWPRWGTRRVAGVLARLGIAASGTTVQRILGRPWKPSTPAAQPAPIRGPLLSKRPHHVWFLDFTRVGGLLRSVDVGAVVDAFGRKVLAIALAPHEPTVRFAVALLRQAERPRRRSSGRGSRSRRGLLRARTALTAGLNPGRSATFAQLSLAWRLHRMRARHCLVAVLVLASAALAWWQWGGGEAPSPVGEEAGRRTPPTPEPIILAGVPPPAAPRPLGPPALRVWVRGVVVDEQGTPVAGARVLVRCSQEVGGRRTQLPATLDATPVAVAGEDGTFSIGDRPPDLHALVAVAPGFAAGEAAGLPEGEQIAQVVRLVLARGRSLTGTVRDSEGRPIARARVFLGWSPVEGRPTPVPQAAETDAAGAYGFDSLAQPLQLGMFSAPGYDTPNGFEDASGWGPTHDATLRRGAVILDVADATNRAPLADARALLIAADDGERVALLEPAHVLEGLSAHAPPGRILLWLQSIAHRLTAARTEAVLVVFAAGYGSARLPLTLVKDAEPPHLEALLTPGEAEVSLGGTVVGGAPAEGRGPQLAVLLPAPAGYPTPDDELPVVARGVGGGEGAFAVRGLPPGAYRLRVERSDGARVVLDVRAPTTDLRIEFAPTGSLEVRVVDLEGNPVAGADVAIEPLAGRRVIGARTDSNGRARLEAVAVGDALVAPCRAQPTLGTLASHPCGQRVSIRAEATATVELIQPSRHLHRLRVIEADDQPVEGVRVRIEGMGHGGAEGEWQRVGGLTLTTDVDGRAAVDLFPGYYRGLFEPPWGGRVEARVTVDPRPGAEQVVRLVRGGLVLRGRVLAEGTDEPVAARPVFAHALPRANRTRLASALTEADGHFVLEGLPAGRIELHLVLSGRGERGAADPDSPWPTARTEIDLSDPQPELVVRVPRVRGPGAVDRPVLLAARVRGPDGTALEAASIHARGLRGGVWIDAGEGRTTHEGRVEVALVAAERYQVTVGGPWLPSPPRWVAQQLDIAPVAGRAEIEATMARE